MIRINKEKTETQYVLSVLSQIILGEDISTFDMSRRFIIRDGKVIIDGAVEAFIVEKIVYNDPRRLDKTIYISLPNGYGEITFMFNRTERKLEVVFIVDNISNSVYKENLDVFLKAKKDVIREGDTINVFSGINEYAI